MTQVSTSTSSMLRQAKYLGFCCGVVAVVACLTQLPARHWVAFRQTIPVAMSLAEAESGFNGLAGEARGTIEKIDGQSASLAGEKPSDGNQLLTFLRDRAGEYKLLGNQYEIMSSQYVAYEAAIDNEFKGWSDTVDTVESSLARIKEHLPLCGLLEIVDFRPG